MATYASIDELLEGPEALTARRAFDEWRVQLADSVPGHAVALDGEGSGQGMRLVLARPFDRLMSAFVFARVLDGAPEQRVALGGDSGDFRTLVQFTHLPSVRELYVVAWGDNAPAALALVKSAVADFDPSAFDSDGYLK